MEVIKCVAAVTQAVDWGRIVCYPKF